MYAEGFQRQIFKDLSDQILLLFDNLHNVSILLPRIFLLTVRTGSVVLTQPIIIL